jgi:plasmid segregation protein ParM
MDAIVRAIDVGYGNTKYVTQAEGGSIRCAHFASVAPATAGQPGAALGDKRRTLGIAIGDLTYEVGPDAHLAAEVYQTRQMHDGYCETPEYLALTRGALGFMKLERIDLLVLGLPVDDPALYDHLVQFKVRRRAEGLRSLAHNGVLTRNNGQLAAKPVAVHGTQCAVTVLAAAVAGTTQDAGVSHAAMDMFADSLAEPLLSATDPAGPVLPILPSWGCAIGSLLPGEGWGARRKGASRGAGSTDPHAHREDVWVKPAWR